MLVNTAIKRAYLLAAGKATMPTVDSTKYTKILELLNMYKDVWAMEPGVSWESTRSLAALAAVVSTTDTYALPTSVLTDGAKLSDQEGDYVRVQWLGGLQETDFTIVPDQKLYRDGPRVNAPGAIGVNSSGFVARRGSNLIFDTAFRTGASEIGGTIYVPINSTPADMVSSTTNPAATVPVDDPMWVVFMAAAEYVRNDVTKSNQYSNLVAQAINSMEAMKMNNDTQLEEVYTGGWSPPGETW